MPALDITHPTLLDVATRTEGDGKITSAIVEMLGRSNEVVDDAVFIEANDGSGHKTTVRTGLPAATWRLLNYGVQPSKSTTAQVKDSCGMLEAYAEVDKSLADLNGNTAAFRMSEDQAFIEAMNQQFMDALFYGNTTVNPERFMGLAPRLGALTGSASSGNVINAGGTGSDTTSIYLVVWGPSTVHMIYPKGSKAGLQMEDKGQVTLEDLNKGKFEGYRTHYKWDAGLVVRDWRYVVRIANIKTSTLTKDGATGADLAGLMTQALELIPNIAMGKAAFYGNRTVRSFLRQQITNGKNINISMDEIAGKKVVAFDGVPFRRVDSILNTEVALT